MPKFSTPHNLDEVLNFRKKKSLADAHIFLVSDIMFPLAIPISYCLFPISISHIFLFQVDNIFYEGLRVVNYANDSCHGRRYVARGNICVTLIKKNELVYPKSSEQDGFL